MDFRIIFYVLQKILFEFLDQIHEIYMFIWVEQYLHTVHSSQSSTWYISI